MRASSCFSIASRSARAHAALLHKKSPALGRAQGATRRERDASRYAVRKFIADRTYNQVNQMFGLRYHAPAIC